MGRFMNLRKKNKNSSYFNYCIKEKCKGIFVIYAKNDAIQF